VESPSLASLWTAATTHSLHGPFCTCGGAGPLTLSSAELEAQIIDFLGEKYGDEPAVLEALADRRARPRASFVRWLEEGLGASGLDPKLAECLRQDVMTVCKSIAHQA
jgi:hypothetical protein